MTRRERAIEAVLKVWPSFEFYSVDRRAVARVVTIVEAELAADLESDETVERVAQALYEAPTYASRKDQTPWAESDWGHQEFDRGQWRIRARAALRSVLEDQHGH